MPKIQTLCQQAKLKRKCPEMLQLRNIAMGPWRKGRGTSIIFHSATGEIPCRLQNSFPVFLIGLVSHCAKDDAGHREGQGRAGVVAR
jgi:hypothetical protein